MASNRFLSLLFWLVFLLAVLYLLFTLLMFVRQRDFIYPRPSLQSYPDPLIRSAGIERIWLPISSGKVESWYLHPVDRTSARVPLVIFAHGNGELIDDWPTHLKPLNDLGLGVLLVEYPGYGRSEGQPTEDSITEAMLAAYDRMVSRAAVDPAKIVLMGRSLGGGAVCRLAEKRPFAALILMSTFTSIPDLAKRFYAPRFLILDRFDNLQAVSSLQQPTLIFHGTRDRIVPYEHATALHQAAPQSQLMTYPCGHNLPCGRGRFWRDLEQFLRSVNILE